MPAAPQIRRSRRLTHRPPVPATDYDWQDAASSQRLTPHQAEIAHLPSPSPSTCTTSTSPDSGSPPAIVTHLPFAPGSSHTRNRKEGHIPRPPNAFMVFRSWLWNKDNLKSIERDNRNVSRIAGRYWNELSEAERAPFRVMAEGAKARHAQLYPQYRYSPASQKKPKVSQRRSQRTADVENEKCNKVVDMLLGTVNSRNVPKVPSDEHHAAPTQQGAFVRPVEEMSTNPHNVASKHGLKRPQAPSPLPQPRSKKQKTPLPSPVVPTLCVPPLPVFPAPEETIEIPTPGPAMRTPQLVYPRMLEEFVPTNEIPYLSLDNCSDLTVKAHDEDLFAFFPSHMKPAHHTVFSGVKPEASSFADSCMLGAYTVEPLALSEPLSYINSDTDPYSSLESSLVPLGPPVFTNPFEPSMQTVENTALLDSLDQLFGQPISALTTAYFPAESW